MLLKSFITVHTVRRSRHSLLQRRNEHSSSSPFRSIIAIAMNHDDSSANLPNDSLANLLPLDLIAEVATYIALYEVDDDGYLNESLSSFISNIGLSVQDRIYIIRIYFNGNLQVLQDLLHSNVLNLDDINEHLNVWNKSQTNAANTFVSLIELSHNSQSQHHVCGLNRLIFSFSDEDGERLDSEVVYNRLDELIQQGTTSYGVPVLKVKSTNGSILRAIDNNSVTGLSRFDILDCCMDKFDNGHSGIALFVTTDKIRSKIIDVAIENHTIACLNRLDPIWQAWLDITRQDSIVSEKWREAIQCLQGRPQTIGRGMFVSTNMASGLVAGVNTNPSIFSPIVQVLQLKPIPMNNEQRWKLVVTDGGMKVCTGLVPGHLIHHVNSGELKLHAVIKVLEFDTAPTSGDHHLFVLLRMQFLFQHNCRIVHPINAHEDVRD